MKLVKRKKRVYIYDAETGSSMPLADASPEDVDSLTVIVGPLGPMGAFFGFAEETRVLYFLKDSDNYSAFVELVQGGMMPIFSQRRAIGGPGTLEMFWKNPETRPATKMLAGALQFIPEDDALYITHMSVQPAWRRNRLNWLMVEGVRLRDPERPIVFDDPTEMGKKFMRSYERS